MLSPPCLWGLTVRVINDLTQSDMDRSDLYLCLYLAIFKQDYKITKQYEYRGVGRGGLGGSDDPPPPFLRVNFIHFLYKVLSERSMQK